MISRNPLRGGSWLSRSNSCRPAYRGGDLLDFFGYYIGFRVMEVK